MGGAGGGGGAADSGPLRVLLFLDVEVFELVFLAAVLFFVLLLFLLCAIYEILSLAQNIMVSTMERTPATQQ